MTAAGYADQQAELIRIPCRGIVVPERLTRAMVAVAASVRSARAVVRHDGQLPEIVRKRSDDEHHSGTTDTQPDCPRRQWTGGGVVGPLTCLLATHNAWLTTLQRLCDQLSDYGSADRYTSTHVHVPASGSVSTAAAVRSCFTPKRSLVRTQYRPPGTAQSQAKPRCSSIDLAGHVQDSSGWH